MQTTVADIAPKVKVRADDTMEARRLKGDLRMADLLRRALDGRRSPLEHDVSLRIRFARAALSAQRVNDLVDSITSRPGPYKAGRLALRARLVSEARRAFRSSGRLGADEPWFERELLGTDEFAGVLDTLWPTVSPSALVRDLLASPTQLERFATGLFESAEWPLLVRPRTGGASGATWSADDLALLDEAAFLTGGRTRTYGHIVIDEAQDLTPMQFRMVARRAPSGSVTVLGDLAQATGPWSYRDWGEVRDILSSRSARPEHAELTLGYRAPGRVLDFASRLLPAGRPRRATDIVDSARADRANDSIGPPGRGAGRRARGGLRPALGSCARGCDRARRPGARPGQAGAAARRSRCSRTGRHDPPGDDRPRARSARASSSTPSSSSSLR